MFLFWFDVKCSKSTMIFKSRRMSFHFIVKQHSLCFLVKLPHTSEWKQQFYLIKLSNLKNSSGFSWKRAQTLQVGNINFKRHVMWGGWGRKNGHCLLLPLNLVIMWPCRCMPTSIYQMEKNTKLSRLVSKRDRCCTPQKGGRAIASKPLNENSLPEVLISSSSISRR